MSDTNWLYKTNTYIYKFRLWIKRCKCIHKKKFLSLLKFCLIGKLFVDKMPGWNSNGVMLPFEIKVTWFFFVHKQCLMSCCQFLQKEVWRYLWIYYCYLIKLYIVLCLKTHSHSPLLKLARHKRLSSSFLYIFQIRFCN